ncbi:MAG: hypothetical protein WDM92_03355 [Caulobacteraceae bacterium]
MDQYLAAMVAHDPERLPLRQGRAVHRERPDPCASATACGAPSRGSATTSSTSSIRPPARSASSAPWWRSGRKVLIAVRLKVVGKKISEVETLVTRTTSMAPASGPQPVDTLTAPPIFSETLPVAQRRSRDEMVAIANSYFEGLEQASGKVTPFEPTCMRREDGMVTAGNTTAPKGSMQSMSCGDQFATGFSPFITEVRGRRFPVVDEEKGLVMAFVSFDHAGKIKTVEDDGRLDHDRARAVRRAVQLPDGRAVQDPRRQDRPGRSGDLHHPLRHALGLVRRRAKSASAAFAHSSPSPSALCRGSLPPQPRTPKARLDAGGERDPRHKAEGDGV